MARAAGLCFGFRKPAANENPMKIKRILGTLFVLAALCGAAAAAAAENNAVVASEPSRPADFQSYQRYLDEIYYLAITPNEDSDMGLNNTIIDLNRRLAQQENDPQTLTSLGHVYRLLGRPDEASRFYEKALAGQPDDYYLQGFSALVLAELGDYPRALERLNRAVELNPGDQFAWLSRARAFIRLNQPQGAIESYEKVLQLDAKNQEAALLLSSLYKEAGGMEEASRLLEKLVADNPQNADYKYELGEIFLKKGDYQKVRGVWQELYLSGMRHPYFLFKLALAYFELGEYGPAKKLLEHLAFFFPYRTDVMLLRGVLYQAEGDWHSAERKFREALAENNRDLVAYRGLVQSLLMQGKKLEAARAQEWANQVIANNAALDADEELYRYRKENKSI